MKNYISRNWKKILMIIGVIFIVIDLFFIITIPPSIPQDFLEFGPNISGDILDGSSQIIGDGANINSSGEIANNFANSAGVPLNIAKIILFAAIGIVALLVLSNILEGGGGDKKKK